MTAIAETAIGDPTGPRPNWPVILTAVAGLVLGGVWLLDSISQKQAMLYLPPRMPNRARALPPRNSAGDRRQR